MLEQKKYLSRYLLAQIISQFFLTLHLLVWKWKYELCIKDKDSADKMKEFYLDQKKYYSVFIFFSFYQRLNRCDAAIKMNNFVFKDFIDWNITGFKLLTNGFKKSFHEAFIFLKYFMYIFLDNNSCVGVCDCMYNFTFKHLSEIFVHLLSHAVYLKEY